MLVLEKLEVVNVLACRERIREKQRWRLCSNRAKSCIMLPSCGPSSDFKSDAQFFPVGSKKISAPLHSVEGLIDLRNSINFVFIHFMYRSCHLIIRVPIEISIDLSGF